MNQPRIHTSWYIVADIVGALFTWLLFYYLRTVIYDYPFSVPPGFYAGALLYVLGWLSLHLLSGAYEAIYQKSTITEIFRTLIVSLMGCFVLLFFFILKNPQENNENYYLEFYSLLLPVFVVTLVIRLFFLKLSGTQLKKEKVFFKVLLIGSGKSATSFFNSYIKTNENTGYKISSFLNINGNHGLELPEEIKKYNERTYTYCYIQADLNSRFLN